MIRFKNETNWIFTGCQVPHFMIVFVPHINLLNFSLIIKCLFLKNMELLSRAETLTMSKLFWIPSKKGLFLSWRLRAHSTLLRSWRARQLTLNRLTYNTVASNWQLPLLNQRMGQNDRRIYFMINPQTLCGQAGIRTCDLRSAVRPQGYNTVFMLNLAEHDFFPGNKSGSNY